MIPNSGCYSWTVTVDRVTRGGCKYIGVINNKDLDQSHLNSNLQTGCRGRRIAWDGSCAEIYHDIDSYGCTHVPVRYKTDDVVGVFVDTDEKEVYFTCNGQKLDKVIGYEG